MTYKGCQYETLLELHTLILINKTYLEALEKELVRKRMMRDINLAEAETKVNLQRNFIKELTYLEESLVDKIDRIAFSLNDIEAQIFLKKFVIGKEAQDIQNELNIRHSAYYRYIAMINEKLKNNADFAELSEALRIKE